MKITMAQLDPVVGDIEGNIKKAEYVFDRWGKSSDLVVFPELFVTGYPPKDLLEKPGFIAKAAAGLEKLTECSRSYPGLGILTGIPLLRAGMPEKGLYNSAVLISEGRLTGRVDKTLLPTYDVFDEKRYFTPADETGPIDFKGRKLGVSICEDMWNDSDLWGGVHYSSDPVRLLVEKGASAIINISASPFYVEKEQIRYRIIRNHAEKYAVPFVFVNQVGGNDELIFDGRSVCIDGKGAAVSVFPSFSEHVETVDIDSGGVPGLYAPQEKIASVYDALVLGVRDYLSKCGFTKAVLGLSGGIDSALTCCIAKDALGSGNVLGIAMPSMYSQRESLDYSARLARNLGVELKVMPVSDIYGSYKNALKNEMPVNDEKEVEVYLQNIQARIRGNILMAFSNKFGYLLLTTGNKSEMAVGYCTIYGDMAGGLAVISDVPKTMVYELSRYVNRNKEIIPRAIIDRVPTAELKPGQKDQDTLPPYDVLDKILYYYLEKHCAYEEIIRKGFDPGVIRWVINAVNKNEYKRRQAPPGLKVTTKAFGTGRRMPVAAKFPDF
ncbi:MAG: NAD+ synthase [Candidatus Omnitrophota bacterium]